MDSVAQKTNFFFSYNSTIIPADQKFSCNAQEMRLIDFLEELLQGTDLTYFFSKDQIILRKDDSSISRLPSGPSNFVIYGWARDAESGEHIPGVNVYLNGTTIGAVTNHNGYYKFDNVPYGIYNLVFSHVSYDKVLFEVSVEGEGGILVNGDLSLKMNQLAGIEVASTRLIDEKDWEKTFEVFRKEFIGDTYNSRRCKILNPEVLEFYTDETGDTLFAEAERALRIRNEALGYMIIYELEYFQNFEDGLTYSGNVRFESLPLLNPKDAAKWKRNRKRTYRGSLRHFLKSLTENNLKKEGFRIYRTENVISLTDKDTEEIEGRDVVIKGKSLFWRMVFEDFIFIEYVKEKESELYLINMTKDIQQKALLTSDNLLFISRKPDVQRSLLKLKDGTVDIDANGHISQPLMVSTIGYWAWQRFADLLPIEYDPKKDRIR